MPTKRLKNLDTSRKNAILDAAAHEFAQYGYEQASVNRIIDAAGIGKSILYYYFENKEDLFVFTISEYMNRFEEALDSVPQVADPDFWEKMVGYYSAFFQYFRDNPVFVGLQRCIIQLSAQPPGNPALEYLANLERKDIYSFIDQLQQQGKIRQDLPLELKIR